MRLLPEAPVVDLAAYRNTGGGRASDRAAVLGPAAVIEEVRAAGLRGRGGGGFPTHLKWRGLSADSATERIVVCNAAEGEPGTFKDRALIRANPYLLLEGLSLAAFATGAMTAFVAIKAAFAKEIALLERAASDMQATGMLAEVAIHVVDGPDDYLFGEESAMLEVIEGNDPLPRLVPPYIEGVRIGRGAPSPTVVNNVETLCNVPGIVSHGAEWFRTMGTKESPGTMVFTVSGDVRTELVAELPMGTPLAHLIYGPAGGLAAGRSPQLVVSGVSNRPLSAPQLDTPLSFDAMRAIGSGLGSGGFIVYDDTTCVVEVGAVLSEFLKRSSCGQCPPCKLGTTAFADVLGDIVGGNADADDLDTLTGWLSRVTDSNRCGLGAGQQALAAGVLQDFTDGVAACLAGTCPGHRDLTVPVFVDWNQDEGVFVRR